MSFESNTNIPASTQGEKKFYPWSTTLKLYTAPLRPITIDLPNWLSPPLQLYQVAMCLLDIFIQ